MAFVPKTWADGSAGGTPITAAELNRIEAGVAGVDADQEALAGLVSTQAATISNLTDTVTALAARVTALEGEPAG
ncbi:hypothetical protein [Gordonia sp. SND2]|uniref:hypothetical protein n=1 Tax=Gordonia sp. SND2 TaxID=3388659 RepID=UPI00398A86ED